ncbi:hypothetical protein [Kitasatospora albolonga]|uniref:hypothetical protein n=1 Tax=Kitasatospora albolonga TaxID=68173 RepID=UPI0031ECC6D8
MDPLEPGARQGISAIQTEVPSGAESFTAQFSSRWYVLLSPTVRNGPVCESITTTA